MRFAASEYFYWLLLLPLLAAGGTVVLLRKLRLARRLAEGGLFERLAPAFSPAREAARLVLLVLAALSMILALARPQFGTQTRLVKRRGVDVVAALDVSKSMLARDVTAGGSDNRLRRAKLEVMGLIEKLSGDRIGLVAFSGAAFVQCPLTSDYAAANLFLRAMEVGSIPVGGTSFAEALRVSRQLFEGAQGQGRSRVLVVISDGEDHQGGWQEELEKLKALGVVVHAIGVGTQIGELIPDEKEKYLHYQGKTVMTRLQEGTLRALAEAGGGLYMHSAAGDLAFEAIYDRIERMQKEEYEARLEAVYEERFQLFALAALVFLLAATLFPERQRRGKEA